MMNTDQSTMELDYIREVSKNGQEFKVLRAALMEALSIYQWKYQQATSRQKRDISNGLDGALKTVKEHLKLLGQVTLIEDLDHVFADTDARLGKTNILSLAVRHMKDYCFNATKPIVINNIYKNVRYLHAPIGIEETRYNNCFTGSMKRAFVEWCEEYPLAEAPAHFDDEFEPPTYE